MQQRGIQFGSRLGALALSVSVLALADAPAPVRVGDRPVVVGLVEHALRTCRLAAPQLPPAECVRGDASLLWLLGRHGEEKKLDQTPSFVRVRQRVLSDALLERVALATPDPSSDALRAELDAHRREFEKPERLRLSRILLGSREEAEKLRARMPKNLTADEFRKLAREHSIDQATHQRGGDLGFVAPDGTTDIPEVRADPALYAAALPLEEGAIAPEPIAEGTGFALVWRRGRLAAVPFDEARATESVRASLRRQAAEKSARELNDELQKKYVRDVHAERLAQLKIPAPR